MSTCLAPLLNSKLIPFTQSLKIPRKKEASLGIVSLGIVSPVARSLFGLSSFLVITIYLSKLLKIFGRSSLKGPRGTAPPQSFRLSAPLAPHHRFPPATEARTPRRWSVGPELGSEKSANSATLGAADRRRRRLGGSMVWSNSYIH